MNICFDTSVVIAALIQQHPKHRIAFPLLRKVRQGKAIGHLTCHAIAELYATLTVLPLAPRLSPAQTHQMIQSSIMDTFQVIPLQAKDYAEALQITMQGNHTSGMIYDALHLVGARSVDCKKLYTLNPRHFRALAPNDSLIVEP